MNVDTVDLGVPILSMHSPFETVGEAGLLYDLQGRESHLRGKIRTKWGRCSAAPFYEEDETLGKRILGWFRRDTVLTISLCLAVSSCLIEPPDRAT